MLKVRAIISYNNRTGKTYTRKLKENENTFNVKGLTFNINDTDGVFIKKRMTYFYSVQDPNPINPYTKTIGLYTPAQYNKGMNTKLLDKFLDLQKPRIDLNMFISLFIIVLIAVGGYFMYSKLAEISDNLEPETTITTNTMGWQ